jgi:hypothetical protein
VAIILVILLALGLAALEYTGRDRSLRDLVLPATLRGAAWTSLGLLIANPGCRIPGESGRPLVLLDASLSMVSAGGRWNEARAEALRLGEIRPFGDPGTGSDSTARAGRSLLADALVAAVATARPVLVLTDGEIEDGADIPADLLQAAAVRLFPRHSGPAMRTRLVRGPSRVSDRDTLRLEAEIEVAGMAGKTNVVLDVKQGGRTLVMADLPLDPGGTAAVELAFPARVLGEGVHLLTVGLADSVDAERRDDRRSHLIRVTEAPGVVLLASPPDWDARFLLATLRDVTALPVEGYAELERGQWRRMSDLGPVPLPAVRRAVGGADLVVTLGRGLDEAGPARATWTWSPSADTRRGEGDWYLEPGGPSPLAGAFVGLPLDSFPPAMHLAEVAPRPGEWVAFTARDGRRGLPRPAVTAWVGSGGRRNVTVLAWGLWRWAFRGGSSEQGYRSWVATTADWLLATPSPERGEARPVREVVARGLPLAFEWTGAGAQRPLGISFTRSGGSGTQDSLRFDGSGRAMVLLDPGAYTYSLAEGGTGTVVVEEWSEEWFPRPATITAAEGTAGTARHRGARDRIWLFGLAVCAFCGEWLVRRRWGLR